jgi:hypothetical protein
MTIRTAACRGAAASLILLLIAARAWAHHPTAESGLAWLAPRSFVEVEVETASFDLEKGSGQWSATTATIEAAFARRWSASVVLPFATIDYDDRQRATGLSDMTLGLRVMLAASEHGAMQLAAGVGLELPSGSEDDGLSGGHLEGSPYIAAAFSPGAHLILDGSLAAHLSIEEGDATRRLTSSRLSSLGSPDAHAAPGPMGHGDGHDGERGISGLHGSVIAPHHDHEIAPRLSATVVLGRAYLAGGLDAAFALGENGETWRARSGVGVLVAPTWRMAAGVDMHLGGERRSGTNARFSITRLMDW